MHGYAENQIWCDITALACDLLAWMAMLVLDGPARRWEPKRLRLRLFSAVAWIVRRWSPPVRQLALESGHHLSR